MNQFELARLKAQKRAERQAKPVVTAVEPVVPVVAPAPKEKGPSNSAVIDVRVSLPDGEITMQFVKAAVYQNANKSRLNKREFTNRILEGLKPLLGEVKAL
jgi:hypothetical protein